VQAGGSDLIFPHHEMSASHARVAAAAGGEVFARRYVHAGMVRLGGEKMSKSLGNLVFVSELRLSGADPMAIRLSILAHHYRTDWDWTDEGLTAASGRLKRWRAAVRAGSGGHGGVPAGSGSAGSGSAGPGSAGPGSVGPGSAGPGSVGPGSAGPPASGENVLMAIRERLADDLDAPGALACVDEWAHATLAGSSSEREPDQAGSAWLVRDAVDALLGVEL
jgi:L-cysteine:1D-myo-inositol 2-amino-2-deoxy-alpha-D-glucopyranoside ligase